MDTRGQSDSGAIVRRARGKDHASEGDGRGGAVNGGEEIEVPLNFFLATPHGATSKIGSWHCLLLFVLLVPVNTDY